MLHHRRLLVAALALALLALPADMLGAEEEDPAFTTIINVPPDEAPSEIFSNTQLNLFEGGSIPSYFDAGKPDGSSVNVEVNLSGGSVGERFRVFSGSTVNISGGSVGDRFIATGSTVDISGGSVGEYFGPNSGSTVNISGGTVGDYLVASSDSTVSISGGSVGRLVANSGSTVNVSGGTVGDHFVASSDTMVNISGGSVGHGFSAFSGSTVNLSGGSVGYGFEARSDSTLTISGGQFMLDGVGISQLPYGGLPYPYSDGKLFTGTLADGSVFIFATEADDRLDSGTTTLAPVTLGPADTTPMVVESGVGPNGLRPSQTLTLRGEGKLADYFAAVDATLHIEGGQVGEGLEVAYSQVDISGGSVGDGLGTFSGSTVNISGGSIGSHFDAYSGSTVNISGGSVGDVFDADSGSTVNISGGTVRGRFWARSGSTVNLSGGQFMLDGAGISQLPAGGLPDGGLFTGTLADGSVFIFAAEAGDRLYSGTTTLAPVTLSPADTTPIVVESGVGPNGLRPGQTLSVRGEGELADHFAAVDATLHIEGGQVGEGLEVAYSQVDISGGSVGDGLDAFSGSTVNISGGSVDIWFEANSGSTVNLSGGSVGYGFDAASGSTVNISGGSVGAWFDAFSGSTVNISGGSVGDGFDAYSGSTLTISGGQFMLDGTAISQLPAGGLPDGGLFTGTLADGSVFIFAAEALDRLDSGTTTLAPVTLGPADTTPMVVESGVGPNGLRPGQTLTLRGEAELADYFAAVDATLHIEGGQVGDRLEVAYSQVNISGGSVGILFQAFNGSTVNISGGSIGSHFDAFPGSTVNISGGSVGRGFDANSGSTVSISGGSVGDDFDALSGSTVNISGGSVGKHFDANSGSTVNLSGGSLGEFFDAFSGSTLNLFGLHFVMDGLDITDTLTPREPMQISHGEVTLGGLLADGSRFSLGVASDATLTITLDAIYGDANLDQVVDVIDLGVLGLGIGGEGDWRSGDFNHDGVVDVIDLGILGLHFGESRGGGTGEVGEVTPEPGGLVLLGVGALAVLGRGKRRRSG